MLNRHKWAGNVFLGSLSAHCMLGKMTDSGGDGFGKAAGYSNDDVLEDQHPPS